MKDWRLLTVGIILVAVGLAGLIFTSLVSNMPGLRGPMIRQSPGYRVPSEFRSNGERIYFTATSASGKPITFSDGPMWLYMHGGSCASCHGPDGRGGIWVMMTNLAAPDIRYRTLTSPEHGREEEEHPPYTDELIERAIAQGLDSAGQPLDPAMPRWHMFDSDLNDLLGYLKTLSAE